MPQRLRIHLSGLSPYTANLCPLSVWVELASFRQDFGDSICELVEAMLQIELVLAIRKILRLFDPVVELSLGCFREDQGTRQAQLDPGGRLFELTAISFDLEYRQLGAA